MKVKFTSLFSVRVHGESMWPERISGKRYFGTSLLAPAVGRTVLANTPEGFVVKRVALREGEEFLLSGTVSWSRNFKVSKHDIVGVLF